MKNKQEITMKLLEAEKMNTYRLLAEFLQKVQQKDTKGKYNK